jgi:hypothetical protein
MDLGFFRRAQTRFASRSAARLDYHVLIATLEAVQSSSAAARSVRGLAAEPAAAPGHASLVELLLAGSGWREAIVARGGSYDPEQARQLRRAA